MTTRMRAFAEIFVALWRQQRAAGVANPRVGRQAALSAGYGDGSWTRNKAKQTADVLYNRLIKRPDVVAYIRQLGLERDGKRWRETS